MAASNNMQHHLSEHHESNNQPDDHNSPANLEVEQVERDDNRISDGETSYSEDTDVLLEHVNTEISDPHEVGNESRDISTTASCRAFRTVFRMSVTPFGVTISALHMEEADDEQQADRNVMQVPENNHPSVDHHPEEEVATNRGILESMLNILNSIEETMQGDLEVEEQTEQVDSRLSEETIMRHIQIKNYTPTTTLSLNEESDICVICQGEFEYGESIGGLHCGHEYHEQCIKTWLQQMNNCPICKATAVL